jgi:hypothetical protein
MQVQVHGEATETRSHVMRFHMPSHPLFEAGSKYINTALYSLDSVARVLKNNSARIDMTSYDGGS